MSEPLTSDERKREIEMWWAHCQEEETVNAADMEGPDGIRLLEAFARVLLIIPDDHAKAFFCANPILVWMPGCRAGTFLIQRRFVVTSDEFGPPMAPPTKAPPTGKDLGKLLRETPPAIVRNVVVEGIFLDSGILRLGEAKLVRVIAEEVAHIVRGREDLAPLTSECEGAAAALMTQWGFKPFRSAKTLRKMREEEAHLIRKAVRQHRKHMSAAHPVDERRS